MAAHEGQFSRRDVLHRSTLAVATSAALARSLAGQPNRTKPSERVRIGLIGAGGRGTEDVQFMVRQGAEVVAVADPDEKHLARAVERLVGEGQIRKPDLYSDYRELLDRNDIDAVDVGTPDHWHALPTIHACQAGKDVFVAKPVSHNVHEGRVMVKAARRYERIVMVGLQQRIGEHFNDAKEYLDTGKLGKISLVKCWHTTHAANLGYPEDQPAPSHVDYNRWLGPAPYRAFNPNRFHGTWRWFWDYAGGKQADWGVHLLDVVQWYMNVSAPVAVSSSGGKFAVKDNTETPDTQCTLFEYPEFLCLWENRNANARPVEERPQHGIAFYGANGTLVISRYNWEVYSEGNRLHDTPNWYQAPGADTGLEMFLAHTKYFLQIVKSRGKPNPDIADGHTSTTTCQLANISLRVGRSIRWDARHERIPGDDEASALLARDNRKDYELPQV